MKKHLYFFLFPFLILLFSVNTHAQSDTNNVVVKFLVNVNSVGTISLYQDTIKEGEIYTIKAHDLPGNYKSAQDLYNALVGSEFYFQDSSLDTNIVLLFTLKGIDQSTGTYTSDSTGSNFFFHAEFDVLINNQLQSSPYYFKNNKYAVLKIKKDSAFYNFMTKTQISVQQALDFVYQETNGKFTSSDIITEEDSTYITAKMRHFSEVVGGSKSALTGVKQSDVLNKSIPTDYVLKQNYPNPFNPSTTIQFALPQKSYVVLSVYNVLGVKVATLVNNTENAGLHSINFDASNLASGLYIYELKTDNIIKTRKMLLLK